MYKAKVAVRSAISTKHINAI